MAITYSKEEMILFCMITIKRQLDDGLIDEEHQPAGKSLDDFGELLITRLLKKIDETHVIPHPMDVVAITKDIYDDDEAFNAMFEVCMTRAKARGIIPEGRIQ